MIIKNCLRCKKEFTTIPAKIKVGKGKYCSRQCIYEKKIINCQNCNAEIKLSAFWAKIQKYCNQDCYHAYTNGANHPMFNKHHSDEAKTKMSKHSLEHPRRYWLGKHQSKEHISKIQFAKKGKYANENHPMWKGDQASYYAIHVYINRHFERPLACEHCGGKNAKKYEWANISKAYKRERIDWYWLCRSCHNKYDDITNKAWRTRKLKYGNSGRMVIGL